mgnify:CR=1 FL=1
MNNRTIQIHNGLGCGGNHLRWLLLMDDRFVIFHAATTEEKTQYILDNVYPELRNCRNWIKYEFKFRFALHRQIKLAHTHWPVNWEQMPELYNLSLIHI